MRISLRLLLPQLALLAAGCDSSADRCTDTIGPEQTFSHDEACALVQKHADRAPNGDLNYSNSVQFAICQDICPSDNACDFDEDFIRASLLATSPTSVNNSDGGTDAGVASPCPGSTGVTVRCANYCPIEGRHTEGVVRFARGSEISLGDYFASCAYAEAVSVLAFERIAAELRAFGAPAELIRDALRAADEEVDHTVKMDALAHAWGAATRRPTHTAFAPRSLFDFALENAIEGCARETFGATAGVLRAERATSREVQVALRHIVADECGHADLSWRIAAWVATKLTSEQVVALDAATRNALRELGNATSASASHADHLLGYVSPDERRALVAQLEAHLPWSVAA